MILDLFAGPGGWSEGLRALGRSDELGLEWEPAACATRAAAGHRTIRTDVAAYPPERFVGRAEGLIASPPCQAFSLAGKGKGAAEIGRLLDHLHACSLGWEPTSGEWMDGRAPLVLEPLRWAWAADPAWIALEQVPAVLPLWQAIASVLGDWGYGRPWVGILNAADYGVAQTRRRAILLARRGADCHPPAPTHAEHPEPSLFGPELQPWVSMAQALGWHSDELILGERQNHGARREMGDPAPTITASLDNGNMAFVPKAVGFPRRDDRGGEGYRERDLRSEDEPAFTITEKGRSWRVFNADQADRKAWAEERPSTTIAGRPLAPDPGANANRFNGSEKSRNDGIRLSVEDGLRLQSFRPDYPVAGTMTAKWAQIGNAVPPLLAERILAELL